MEHKPKRRTVWSGKWIWAAILISLPAAFAIPLSVQNIPNEKAWKAFNAHVSDELNAKCGTDAGAQYARFGREWQKQATSATQLLATLSIELTDGYEGLLLGQSRLAQPFLRAAEAGTGDVLSQLASAAASGCVHPVQPAMTMSEIEAGFVAIHRVSRLHVNLACLYATQGDWETALRHIEAAARSGDSLRYYGMEGSRLAMAVRTRALEACGRLLGMQADAATCKRIIQAMRDLAATEPHPDLHVLCGNYLKEIQLRAEDPALPAILQSATLANMVLDGPFTRPQYAMFAPFSPQLSNQTYILPWTQLGAAFAAIRRVVNQEPGLLAARADTMRPLNKTDALYRALCVYSYPGDLIRQTVRESRTMATHRELVQLACQARIYREQHGNWPETAAEAGATTMPARLGRTLEWGDSLTEALAAADKPYGPLQAGGHVIFQNNDNLAAWLGFRLGSDTRVQWGDFDSSGSKVVLNIPVRTNNPDLSPFVAHCIADICIQRFGDRVTSAAVFARYAVVSPAPGPAVAWGMLPGMAGPGVAGPGMAPPEMMGGPMMMTSMPPIPPVPIIEPTGVDQAVELARASSDLFRSVVAPPDNPTTATTAKPAVESALLHLEISVPISVFAVWPLIDDQGKMNFAVEPGQRFGRANIVYFLPARQ